MNVRHVEGVKNATIYVYSHHIGHDPRSRRDLYYLPVHPKVLDYCMEDLFDVGCARHVVKMSIMKEIFHKSKATPLEHVCYRFFMLPKEVHNTVSKFNIRNALSEDDWGTMMHDASALKL